MKKVIFVCLGNICRSPMAEALLREKAQAEGLAITVDSAATSRWELGNPPHPGTQKILNEQGIACQGMVARQITTEDFYEADWIIGMDQQNIKDLLEKAPAGTEGKVHLLMSVVPGQENTAVPDPYYTGDFNETYQLIQASLNYWVTKFFS